ncbi:hypothetical protein [Flavihumibacter sp. UBA7668]|uniref:hypothetical protein n=1 Tax=Flavihumibacter sp. UBA7668 TaxID=1946542 RepID=UPI0025BDE125|nr:hypothetical protein [Flavihumibacter sp. UBA7668]
MNLIIHLAVSSLLLAGCSKVHTRPSPSPEPKPATGMVQFKVYADPALRLSRPATADAGIRLSILQSSFTTMLPVAVWDTLLPLQQLSGFPGPKDPVLINKNLELESGKKQLFYLTAHKMYRIGQEIRVDEISKGFSSVQELVVLDIGL